jgi:hypothetical protein
MQLVSLLETVRYHVIELHVLVYYSAISTDVTTTVTSPVHILTVLACVTCMYAVFKHATESYDT